MTVPTVSVIIPAYNQAQYLTTAIESVFAQTYRDFEMIVVNDGSTDATPQVMSQFAGKIRPIHQDNRGLAGARNTGIRAAQGTYVALLDCDDVWLPAFLETMMQSATQTPEASLWYGGWQYIDEQGTPLPQAPNTLHVDYNDAYHLMLRTNFVNGSAVLVKREELFAFDLFDESFRSVEDWELWLRMLHAGIRFHGVPVCLVHYRLHTKSLSADPKGMYSYALQLVEKHLRITKQEDNKYIKAILLAGIYRYIAILYLIRRQDWQTCATYLQQAMQTDSSVLTDLDTYYQLALGTQPLGYRNTSHHLDLVGNAHHIQKLIAHIQAELAQPQINHILQGMAYYGLGRVAYHVREWTQCRQYLAKALYYYPPLRKEKQCWLTLLKSSLPTTVRNRFLH